MVTLMTRHVHYSPFSCLFALQSPSSDIFALVYVQFISRNALEYYIKYKILIANKLSLDLDIQLQQTGACMQLQFQ